MPISRTTPQVFRCSLEKWREGYQVIYAIRTKRKEFFLKRWLFYWFYRMFRVLSPVYVPPDAGNFGLIDRKVIEVIMELGEYDRFYPGLRSWVGFRQTGVTVERQKRYDDRARVTIFGLLRLAKNAIFSFSSMPLMVFYAVALINLSIGFALTSFSLYHKLFTGKAIPGWTSIIVGRLYHRRFQLVWDRHSRRIHPEDLPPGPAAADVHHCRRYRH